MVGTSSGLKTPETGFRFGTGLLPKLGYSCSGLSSSQMKQRSLRDAVRIRVLESEALGL